ncbi:MAG: hypothetical protein AAFZ15_18700 [Bacteroidota bacterium]
MKTIKSIIAILAVMVISLSLNAQSLRIAMVDYMYVPAGGGSDYVKLEKEVWKPMHQEWVNQGKMVGWYLYRIPYPGGTSAEYHYATVRIYDDLADIESPMADMDNVFKKVHPGKDLDKLGKQTMASRSLVKTYAFSRWEAFFKEGMTEPAKISQVVSFKVAMDKWDAYMEMERKYFHPTHHAEIEAGTRAGWAGWVLRRPMGTNAGFQFVAVDHFKDWAQYTKRNPEDLFDEVFDNNELEYRDRLFNETAEIVNIEEWRLVDYVQANPEDTAEGGNE